MVAAGRRSGRALACGVIAVLLAALVFAAACGGPARQHARAQANPPAPGRSAPSARQGPASAAATHARTAGLGTAGRYRVGQRQMILAEPAHAGVTGQHLGERFLMTVIDYPAAGESPGSQLAPGPFPLLIFAPGFLQCADTYADLLHAWASAGYVVASVISRVPAAGPVRPRTSPTWSTSPRMCPTCLAGCWR
jgi:hypothetical protein